MIYAIFSKNIFIFLNEHSDAIGMNERWKDFKKKIN